MTSIVVADDEVDILDSTQQVLILEGFKVTTVQDPKAIQATLRRIRPDVLLQDVNMPGLELAKLIPRLRADATLQGMRILVFTASVDGAAICEDLKADGVVQKPFDATRIKGIIERSVRPQAKRRA